MIAARIGDPCDLETLRRDSQSLLNTGRFSSINLQTEPGPTGVIVRFTLVERPVILSIDYQGDDTLTMTEILERFHERKLQLRAETFYHEDELGIAAATIQELAAEKGRRDLTITPQLEKTSPTTVRITFRAAPKP
jgi:outer membrane protein insertion porin family